MNSPSPTKATLLSLYMEAHAKHRGELQYEWLLEHAKSFGIGGGSAFRATCGFGRHGVLREQFFEMTDNLPVKLELLLESDQVEPFLASLEENDLHMIYALSDVSLGRLGGRGS